MFNRDRLGIILNDKGLVNQGVEIGVKEGVFSEIILSHWKGNKLFLVDCYEYQPNGYVDIANVSNEVHEQFYKNMLQRVSRFGDRAEIIKKYSHDAINDFDDQSLDFVYIDANHKYESVMQDMELWFPKVKQGGLLSGHDCIDGYAPDSALFGVLSAVTDFCAKHNLTFEKGPCSSWYIWK